MMMIVCSISKFKKRKKAIGIKIRGSLFDDFTMIKNFTNEVTRHYIYSLEKERDRLKIKQSKEYKKVKRRLNLTSEL